jgi:DNA-binding GntR family transcriptional regulator
MINTYDIVFMQRRHTMKHEYQKRQHEKAIQLKLKIQAFVFADENIRKSRTEVARHFGVSENTVRLALKYVPNIEAKNAKKC